MPNFVDNIIQEQTITAVYSIISLSVKEDNKWRVGDGNNIFNVVIKDDDFIKNIINNSIVFSKDDILKCDVKITSYSTINGLKTDYEIIKVLEHKKAYRQLDLFN